MRALKSHGGADKETLGEENLDALRAGLPNLVRHIQNVREVWNLPAVVAVNRFTTDTDAEIALVREAAAAQGVRAECCDVWARGGEGGEALGRAVLDALQTPGKLALTYENDMPLKAKIEAVCKRIYHASGVTFAPGVLPALKRLEAEGCGEMPVCIAKTQYSFSDNQKLLGAPEGFTVTIRDVRLSRGAGFVVAFAGSIIAMPGLPKSPAAERIGLDENGAIYGLF